MSSQPFLDGQSVERSLEKLMAIVDGAVDGIVAIDEAGSILLANRACESLLGYRPEELVGQPVELLMPPPHSTRHAGYVADYLAGGAPHIIGKGREVEARRKDGSLVSVDLSVSETVFGDRRVFTGFFHDLTETRRVAEALHERSAKFSAIVDTAVDAIVTIDERGTIESVNPACECLFDYRAEELVGKNVKVLMPEPYRSAHDGYLESYLSTGVRHIIGIGREVEGQRRDGSTFPVDLAVSEVVLEDRRLFTGVIRDISERKEAERTLRDSEERYRSLVENAGVAIVALSPQHEILEWNARAEELFGHPRAEAVSKDFLDLVVPPEEREAVASALARGLAGEPTVNLESPARCHDGTQRIVLWNAGRLLDSEGQPIRLIASGQDITDQKAAQQRLVEREALAKLGEMSTMVAHEIKNPLAGILGATRLLRQKLPGNGMEHELCDEMVARIMALDESVRDILTFARPKAPSLKTVPARLLVEDVIGLLEQDPKFSAIEISIDGPGDLMVTCDVDMMKPVLHNIFVNAAQALDATGHIEASVLDARDVDGAMLTRFRVHDSGPGIPQQTLARIFEPFFTTKGAGTGLGLPIARRVVELHGGTITVDCPAEGGTTVTVDLPSGAARGG